MLVCMQKATKAQCYQIVYAPMFGCQLDTLSPVDAALEMRSTLGDDNDGKMRTADEGPFINDVCTEGVDPKDKGGSVESQDKM